MEDQRQNMPTEETIDKYDDEYGEDENYQSNTIQAPIEVPQPKVNLLQEKDEIQINPEEDENTDEENIINDPKVKELNELDINNKKAIIDILMDEDLIEKKPIKNSEYVKDINKIKFSYVKSNTLVADAMKDFSLSDTFCAFIASQALTKAFIWS